MFIYRKVILILLLLPATCIVHAQAVNIDSLQFIIKFNQDNAEKVNAYKVLSQALLFKNFDSCQATSLAVSLLAQKLKDDAALSELKKITGLSWYFKGVYDSAAAYYYKALDIAKNVKDPSKKAAILNELGKLYRKTKDLDRALQMYNEAYVIYEKMQDEANMATILNE